MKWICPDCPWAGDEQEMVDMEQACPLCGSGVMADEDEHYEPDYEPDDEAQTFRNVEVSALCAEWNL